MSKLKLSKEQSRLWYVFVFLVRIMLLSIPLYVILWANPSMEFIQYAVRDSAILAANLIGIETKTDGFYINLNTVDGPVSIDIGADCTGWKSAIAYLALVLAVPRVKNKKRLVAMVGIPIIYAVNIGRIVFLLWAAVNMGFGYFRVFHEYLWKLGMSLAVIAVWYVWLTKKAGKIKPEKFISY
ncbi:MAG: exosortase/archaeosortase family protein [Candidatus Aenigmarchaeota archaeon]|nr:exosortase/archaeosortase family protein [Candidatus Aenigmarchaeota archaeon]